MGYSHYFRQTGACPLEAWKRLCDALPDLELAAGVPLGDGRLVGCDFLRFNGQGDDAGEDFTLKPNAVGGGFCKTDHKPYDVVVVAMLCLAHTWAPGLWRISSDGNFGDWQQGLELARVVDFAAECPLAIDSGECEGLTT